MDRKIDTQFSCVVSHLKCGCLANLLLPAHEASVANGGGARNATHLWPQQRRENFLRTAPIRPVLQETPGFVSAADSLPRQSSLHWWLQFSRQSSVLQCGDLYACLQSLDPFFSFQSALHWHILAFNSPGPKYPSYHLEFSRLLVNLLYVDYSIGQR